GEYRSAMKGESWKIDLINVIDEVMKSAKTQKQFCFLMRQKGYSVRWEESRKYITYTCPNGKRCRDNRLHEPRYSKEMMLNEFKIRSDEIGFEIKSGRSDEHTTGDICSRQQLESSDSSAYVTHPSGRTGQQRSHSDYDRGRNDNLSGQSASDIQSGGKRVPKHSANDSGADNQLSDELNQPIGETVVTGWEAERGILLAAERIRRMEAQNAIENAQSDCDFADGAALVIAGIADVAAIIDEPEEDEDVERHSDSKVLAEEIRRKEALGMHMG
ncbi:MAG: relaxase, partial [Ruminococcus sp.]|nr:relaxase [Ruminococcus sp.]